MRLFNSGVLHETVTGSVTYLSLSSKFLNGALNVMKEGFYPQEPVCKTVGLPQQPGAVLELEELTKQVARDGVSIIAIESATERVIGAAFNKLQVKNDPYFENYTKSCKYSSSQAVMKFMIDADAACDLFEHCHVDCLMEIMFLGTLPESRGKGIATKLVAISTEVAKSLLSGENIKQAMDVADLTLEPIPKIASAMFTSPISQNIARRLNWETVARISYEKCFHEGKTFASMLGKDNPDTILVFTRL